MTEGHTPDLIERIEVEDGACRDIDVTIWYNLLGRCKHLNKVRSGAQSDTGFDCPDCGADSWGNTGPTGQKLHDSAPAYTKSIDAAMQLIPDKAMCDGGWRVEYHHDLRKRCHATVWLHIDAEPADGWFTAWGSTPALALCAASLKARSILSRAQQGGGEK